LVASKSTLLAAVTGLLALTAAPAYAADADELTASWAKVNVCNSSELGARAQLAGDGSDDRMRVRFTAEWLGPDGWAPLAGQATSPWQDAGSAEFTWGQAGWTFALTVPENDTGYQLRAVAELELGSGRSATQTTGTCAVGGSAPAAP
jgi:hypothetical protein